MKFALIKELKNPPDKRVVLNPEVCQKALKLYPEMELAVEASPIRCYQDAEYAALGIPVTQDLSDCDVLIGVKEVPIEALIPGKKYFFFSRRFASAGQRCVRRRGRRPEAAHVERVAYHCRHGNQHRRRKPAFPPNRHRAHQRFVGAYCLASPVQRLPKPAPFGPHSGFGRWHLRRFCADGRQSVGAKEICENRPVVVCYFSLCE